MNTSKGMRKLATFKVLDQQQHLSQLQPYNLSTPTCASSQ
jgi:hypothetical protein